MNTAKKNSNSTPMVTSIQERLIGSKSRNALISLILFLLDKIIKEVQKHHQRINVKLVWDILTHQEKVRNEEKVFENESFNSLESTNTHIEDVHFQFY